jgi:hypothetical protein
MDCSSEMRGARLHGPRQQPELAEARMDQWAAYLRDQADSLNLPVIETTSLTITEAADQLEDLVRRLIEFDPPGA